MYSQPNQEVEKQPEIDLLSRLKRMELSLQRLESGAASAKSPHPSESIPLPNNAHSETPAETRSVSELGNGKLIRKEGDTRYSDATKVFFS